MTEIVAPFTQFFDTSGAPLANGMIYIGTTNQDAETNPIAVFWDEALTIPAPQPIRTLNGYPVWNGAPARLYANVDSYSMTVRNAQGRIVYSVADVTSATLLSDFQAQLAAPSGSNLVGFIQAGTGAVARPSLAKMRDIFNARDFGVAATGAVDDTAAMQEAINHVQNNGGGILHLPPGFIFVSSPLLITKSIIIAGAGIGLGSGVGNSGGTVIRSTVAAGNVFTVNTEESVGFRDFAIDASVTKAANTVGIYFAGPTGSGSINRRSRVSNLRISNMYDAIRMDTASDFVVHGCHIQDYTNIGIYSKQTGGVDSGHNVIDSCVLWDLNVGTSQASIRYDKGGDIRVVNCKLLGGTYGARLAIDDGETGTVIFTGNSFEQSIINIRVEQAVTSKNFGNIVIAGNQFSQIIGAGLVGNPQSNISIQSGTPAAPASHWVKNIAIVGNVINNAHNQAAPMISVQDGEGVTITGNQGTANGFANPTGIDIGPNVGAAKVSGNVFSDTPGGSYPGVTARYQVPAATLDFSTGASTVAAGLTRFLGRANVSANLAECLFYLPFKAKVLNLHVNASLAPGAGQSFTYVLQVNGVDTSLFVTVSEGLTDGQNRINIVPVPSPAGPNTAARISLKLITSAGAAAAVHQATMTVVEDD